MTLPNQALFEAPASYEMPYGNPNSNPEWENEWENPGTMPYGNPNSNPEWESEWENPGTMSYSNPYSNPEWEDEGEYFDFKTAFSALGKGISTGAKLLAPLAKNLAPKLVGGLVSMIPGAGVIAGPLAAKLTSTLLKEGEMEAMQMEAEFFGTNKADAEVGNTDAAHEAALTEFLAAQAAEATTDAEAEANMGATAPINANLMGGRIALQPVMPTIIQATARLTEMMRKRGSGEAQLVRVIPTIQRQAMATLKAAARSGRPINSATALSAMAAATRQVLGNPQRFQGALVQNAVLRQQTAPPTPQRTAPPNPRTARMGR
jgi:hypothetical protein